MLDAFIIDRIHREREIPEGAQVPLRIEIPLPPPQVEWRRPEPGADDRGDRGIVEVDFSI